MPPKSKKQLQLEYNFFISVQERKNSAAFLLLRQNSSLIYMVYDSNNAPVISAAIQANNFKFLERALEIYREDCEANKQFHNILKKTGDDGYAPLFLAIYKGSIQCVDLLITHGADINDTDSSGRNAFFYAVLCLNQDDTEQLKNIVNIIWRKVKELRREQTLAILKNMPSLSKETLLRVLFRVRQWDIVKDILQSYSECITYQAEVGLPLMHLLVMTGVEIEVRKALEFRPAFVHEHLSNSDFNLLHSAALRKAGDKETAGIIKALLDEEVDPFHECSVKFLKEQFIRDPDIDLRSGFTPLGVAILRVNYHAVTNIILWMVKKKKLETLNSNANELDETYLHLIIRKLELPINSTRVSREKKIEGLAARTADAYHKGNAIYQELIDQQNSEDASSGISSEDAYNILKWLCKYSSIGKGIINRKDATGATPVMTAISVLSSEVNVISVLKLLLDLRPDLTIKNKANKDALELAQEKGFQEVVTLLQATSLEWKEVAEKRKQGQAQLAAKLQRKKEEEKQAAKEKEGNVNVASCKREKNFEVSPERKKQKSVKKEKKSKSKGQSKPSKGKTKAKEQVIQNKLVLPSSGPFVSVYSKTPGLDTLIRQGNEPKAFGNRETFFNKANNKLIQQALMHAYNFYALANVTDDVVKNNTDLFVKASLYHLLRFCRATEQFSSKERRLGNAIIHAALFRAEFDQLEALKQLMGKINGIIIEKVLSKFDEIPQTLAIYNKITNGINWNTLFSAPLQDSVFYQELVALLDDKNDLDQNIYAERIQSEIKSLKNFVEFADKIKSYDKYAEIDFSYNPYHMAACRMSIIIIGECWGHINSNDKTSLFSAEQQKFYAECQDFRNKLAHEVHEKDINLIHDFKIYELAANADNFYHNQM